MDKYKYKRIVHKMVTDAPCIKEMAIKRVYRAIKMSAQTGYVFEIFIELETQMCLHGISFTGESISDFYSDNLKLQLFCYFKYLNKKNKASIYCESTKCEWNKYGECTQEMICLDIE
ncbi:hypothetical protein LCGC14_0957590 [marine sediment metagenome]|uniref:Uncharacterized protein n=1 Tax=marine sediment metagenome TaxID=412755 RepID=A0A0F9NFJ0_9ZZZZ